MAEKGSSRAAEDSPKSAARFIRAGARAILASGQGVSQYRAEYRALIEWADRFAKRLPFNPNSDVGGDEMAQDAEPR